MARIALNGRLLISGKLEGIGWFTHSIYQRIIANHPEHDFLLLIDRPLSPEFHYGDGVEAMRLFPPARRPFLVDIWMDWAVPRALRSWGADVFVSTDGFISRRVNLPQLAVMHDLNFEHHPEWLPKRDAMHYQQRFRSFSQIAGRIATVSEYSRQDIHSTYGVPLNRIDVVPNAPSTSFTPLENHERQEARDRWNAGRPYYCFIGSLHPRKNLPGLLAAHEAYRHGGGVAELLVVGAPMWGALPSEWREAHGVRWMGRMSAEDLPFILGGSEGLVYLPFFEGFGIPLVEAMAAGVPVIAASTTSLPEVAGDAAAGLVDPLDAQGAADVMLQLESQPDWKANRVEAGLKRAADFSWDRSAIALWKSIELLLP